MNAPPANRLVAIVGGGESGSGWLAERLGRLLGEQAGRLDLDFDHPRAIDWDRAEQTLRDCQTGRAAPERPKSLVLVEGRSLLERPSVRQLFDLKIYLDGPPRIRPRRAVTSRPARKGERQRRRADLILAQPFRKTDVLRLAAGLWSLLSATAPFPAWMRVPFQSQLLNLLECHDHAV
jgi:uridine kinase